MLFKNILWPAALLPFVVAAIVYAISTQLGSRRTDHGDSEGNWTPGAGLAIAAAFLTSYVAMTGWPRWLPVEATQRLFFVVLGLGIVSIVLAGRLRRLLRVELGLLVFLGLLSWILQPPIQNSFSRGQTVLWLSFLTLCGVLLLFVFERSLTGFDDASDVGSRSLSSAVVTLALLGGSSVLLGVSESVRLAQLLSATTFGVLAIEIVSRRTRRPGFVALDALVLSTIVLGLLVCGYFYAELAALPATLCLISFLLLALTANSSAAKKWISVLPLLIALTISAYAYLNQPEDPYAGYYESDAQD